MTDKIKTGPGVHPDRQTKTAEPTRRSLFGLSSSASKGELTVPKQSSKVSEFLDKAERTPHKTERAVEGMLNKPHTRREAMETARNAASAARMAGKAKIGKPENYRPRPNLPDITKPEHIAKLPWTGSYMADRELFDNVDKYTKSLLHKGDKENWKKSIGLVTKHGMGLTEASDTASDNDWHNAVSHYEENKTKNKDN